MSASTKTHPSASCSCVRGGPAGIAPRTTERPRCDFTVQEPHAHRPGIAGFGLDEIILLRALPGDGDNRRADTGWRWLGIPLQFYPVKLDRVGTGGVGIRFFAAIAADAGEIRLPVNQVSRRLDDVICAVGNVEVKLDPSARQ